MRRPGQACRGREAAVRSRHKAGQCQAWLLPLSRPPSLPPSGPSVGRPCVHGARAAVQRQSCDCGAEEGPARRGPGLSRRKTSQGLQIAALSFFFTPPAWERKKKKKQRFLWRRMQKGCRILTISCTGVFPSGVWAQAWHGGTTGGDWPERMRPLSGTHGEPGLLSIPPRSWAGGRTMRTRDQGAQGPPRAGGWWPTGLCHSRLSCRLHACLAGLSHGVERGAWALG